MSISWDNNYKTESNCEILPDSDEVQIIKLKSNGRCKGLPLPNQFKDLHFKFVISTNELNKNNSPYYFRVRPIYKNRPHVIDLNSDKEISCEFNEDHYCYFLVPLFSYDELSTIVLYADTTHDIIFYAKSISSYLYHECDNNYPCYYELLPKSQSYQITSKDKFITSKDLLYFIILWYQFIQEMPKKYQLLKQ